MRGSRIILRAGPSLALLAWAANFSVLYALATYGCDRRALGWMVTAACAAVALAVLLGAALSRPEIGGDLGDRDPRFFARPVAAVVAGLVLVAIAWQGFAVLALPGCRS